MRRLPRDWEGFSCHSGLPVLSLSTLGHLCKEVEERRDSWFRCPAWGQGLTKGHQARTQSAMAQLRGNPGQRILFREAGVNGGRKSREAERRGDRQTHTEEQRWGTERQKETMHVERNERDAEMQRPRHSETEKQLRDAETEGDGQRDRQTLTQGHEGLPTCFPPGTLHRAGHLPRLTRNTERVLGAVVHGWH